MGFVEFSKKNRRLGGQALFIVLLAAAACGDHQNLSISAGTAGTDSLLAAYNKQVQVDPANTLQEIRTEQESVADSVTYYRLNGIMAIGYFMDNKPDSAIIYAKKTVRFCKNQNPANPDLARLASKACNDLGLFYQLSGQMDSAIVYLKEAASIAGKSGEKHMLPDIYVNIADNYNHRSDFPSTAHYYRKALFIADSLNHGSDVNYILSGLAHVYTNLKNYKEADYFFCQVENVVDSLPVFDRYYFCNSRGNYYYGKNEYEKALPWFRKANSAARLSGQDSFIATTECNIGELYLLLDGSDSAKYYFDRAAVHFLSDAAHPSAKFYLNGLFASYYLEKGDLDKAQTYLSQTDNTFQPNSLYIFYNTKRREDLYRKQGNYRKAYEMNKIAGAYDDSIRNITIQNNIAEIDSRYRQDTIILKRDIQLAHKEQKLLETQKANIFIISLFVITALVALIISIYQRKKRELRQMRQMSVITRLRMESIRNRISPHFMFNVLNSVVPGLREHESLVRPMQLLVESIRESLTLSEKLAITLEEEIKLVKTYLALVETMNTDKPEIRWEISPNVDLQTYVPSMILQIPVENAIKYAFDSPREGNLIVIGIEAEDHVLNIAVQDNGKGFNAGRSSDTAKGTGTGLKVLYKTIEMLNVVNDKKMEFEMKNEVNISSNRYGTGVFIKIPYNYKYEL